MAVRGRIYLDRSTKHLLLRLPPHSIAVVAHQDLDRVAAEALLERRVTAVINAYRSATGAFPNRGPELLLQCGVPVVDEAGEAVFTALHEGDYVELKEGEIWKNNKCVARGHLLRREDLIKTREQAEQALDTQLEQFIKNTLNHALKEKELILGRLVLPPLRTPLKGRHAVVVVRGPTFRADLRAILPYIREVNPVLIAVDGGADALLDSGLKPDLIVGDMDSVSDRALFSGAELVVHAYPDGRAPGLARLAGTSYQAAVLPTAGTSEDAALLLAYHAGCRLIVLVGSHSNMIEFLEKGRAGMGSTFLVRLLVGSILVDAKGVNQLYRLRFRPAYLASLLAAGMFSAVTILLSSLYWQQLLTLWGLKLRLFLGF
ncbi:MAG TPA: hypothetical protein GX511_01475 [Firmicutes bacterium]|nr:hypothetical protein [Bacillota bacterium]